MNPNYTNFPRNFFEKKIACFIPSTAVAGQVFYFDPDGIIDESFVIGLQFLPSNGYSVYTSITNGFEQASSSDAENALISLVNKQTEQIFQDYPVNGLFNPGTNASSVNKVVRTYQMLQTKKCFIKWTGASPANNLQFIFAIYYKPNYTK